MALQARVKISSLLIAVSGLCGSVKAQVSFSRHGSVIHASWLSAAQGTWEIQDSNGNICINGTISPGENTISLAKVASSTDLILRLRDFNLDYATSTLIPGEILTSPLPKVSQAAVIYQLAPRTYFARGLGRERTGSLDDLTVERLEELKSLGVDYLWLTGVLENASLDNSDSDVVKGDAGSYYAINDKWDIASSLGGLSAFEALISRAHAVQLRVLIDLVANHTARTHATDVLCKKHLNFGNRDEKNDFFSPHNNYFYLPGSTFYPPTGQGPALGDGVFDTDLSQQGIQLEIPAKVTGNDVVSANPLSSDWFETAKLNYGWNFVEGNQHFAPRPRTWDQIVDVASYWLRKGVDGFRVDYAHAVPLNFWKYFVEEVRKVNPNVFLLGEAYESDQRMKTPDFSYRGLMNAGFDSIYDSELYWGMYLEAQHPGNMRRVQFENSPAAQPEMLDSGFLFTRYMENHDEVRVASVKFLPSLEERESRAALGFAYTAYLGLMPGHLMLHGGQEFQEDASIFGGFAGDNGRTSIFDYIYQSQTWKWHFGERDPNLVSFRDQYVELNKLKRRDPFNLIHRRDKPSYINLDYVNRSKDQSRWIASYLRYSDKKVYIVVINSDPHAVHPATLHFTRQDGEDSDGILGIMGVENSELRYVFSEVLFEKNRMNRDSPWQDQGVPGRVLYKSGGIPSGLYLGDIPPGTTYVFEIKKM